MAAEECPVSLVSEQAGPGSDDAQRWKRRLLQTCVPVNALTEDHLNTLLRETRVTVAYRGQQLFDRGDCDGQAIYLLSGAVELQEPEGPRCIRASDAEACFPLVDQQPRPLRAVALEDCHIIRFDSERLDAMLAWDQAAKYIELDIAGSRDLDEDAEWMLTLLRSNLFYKVPPMNIRQILDRFQAEYYAAGDVVLRQGELGNCCYFIKEGRVGVYRAEKERGRSERVAELGIGRCFGEDALVNDAPRNATITMLGNGVLMRLDKQSFFLLLRPPSVQEVGYGALCELLAGGARLLDVRTMDEYERGHAKSAVHMPLSILTLKSRLLDPDRTYITYCNSGRRSAAAAHFLGQEGYRVAVLRGGLDDLPLTQRMALLSGGDPDFHSQLRNWHDACVRIPSTTGNLGAPM